jgi:hypothetical protein
MKGFVVIFPYMNLMFFNQIHPFYGVRYGGAHLVVISATYEAMAGGSKVWGQS